jgi:hypothetical protein
MIATQLWKGADRLALFGAGPWLDEPDRLDWQHDGVQCFIHREQHLGHLCGYVGVEPGHPWHGEDYRALANVVDIHGGLTFAGDHCRGYIHQTPAGVVWWLGFDCCHCGDLCPFMVGRFASDVYRDISYVKAQTECLAQQVRVARRMTLEELIKLPGTLAALERSRR